MPIRENRRKMSGFLEADRDRSRDVCHDQAVTCGPEAKMLHDQQFRHSSIIGLSQYFHPVSDRRFADLVEESPPRAREKAMG